MAIFHWDESYSVKNRELDKQHQKWIKMLNDFYEHAEKASSPNKIKKLLDSAIEYTETHFKTEERLIEKAEYPELENHKRMHDMFKSRLKAYEERYQEGELPVSLSVTSEMRAWMKFHIKEEDHKYIPYISKE